MGLFATLPIERGLTFDVLGFTIRPVFVFMGIFLVAHLRSIPRGVLAMPTALLVIVAVLASLPRTYDPTASLGYAAWAFFVIAFSLALTGYLRGNASRFELWGRIYVVTAAAWGLFLVGQWCVSFAVPEVAYAWLGSIPRVHGPAYEPSFLAFYFVAPLFFSLAIGPRSCGVLILAGLLLSTSRAGLLGVAVGAAAVVLLGNRSLRMHVAKGVLVAALVVAVAVGPPYVLNYQPVGSVAGAVQPRDTGPRSPASSTRDDAQDFVTLSDEASTQPRLESWRDGWEMFLMEPVTGVGVGGSGAAYHARGVALDVPASQLKTTNLWIEVMAEMGILGFVALAAWALLPFPILWRYRSRSRVAVPTLAALLALVVMCSFVQTWWVPYRWIPWVFAYVVIAPTVAEWIATRGTVGRLRHGDDGASAA